MQGNSRDIEKLHWHENNEKPHIQWLFMYSKRMLEAEALIVRFNCCFSGCFLLVIKRAGLG